MRRTIRHKTYDNFKCIHNALMREKHYDYETALNLAENLFETLEGNPLGNIWKWFDMMLTAEEYAEEYGA